VEPDRQVEADDFYGGFVDGKIIEIKVTFTDLSNEELSAFSKYTRTGELTVARRFLFPGKGTYYGYTQRVPEFVQLLSSGTKTDQKKSFNALAGSQDFESLQKTTSSEDMLAKMEEFQGQHPERCQWSEEGTQFYGFAGKYALNDYTKFVFVPAVKEAADEISGGSLKELMNTVVLRRINENPLVVNFNTRLQQEAQDIFRLENFPELGSLSMDLNKTLQSLSPGASIGIDWGTFTPPALRPPQYEATLTEDGYSGDPSRKGHGLQRALVMTLLQHLQMLRVSSSNEEAPEPAPAAHARTDLVLLIEEPELYLHPHRSRYLSGLLAGLTEPSITLLCGINGWLGKSCLAAGAATD
jgi:hypothetical protein